MTKKEQVLEAVSKHPGKLAGFYEQQVGFVCTAELRQLKNAGALKRTGKRASFQYWLPGMVVKGTPATKRRLFSPEKLERLDNLIQQHGVNQKVADAIMEVDHGGFGSTVVFKFKSGRTINLSQKEYAELKERI